MTTDKARFETEIGVCLKPIPKMYTSTIVKGDKLDSETEDDECRNRSYSKASSK